MLTYYYSSETIGRPASKWSVRLFSGFILAFFFSLNAAAQTNAAPADGSAEFTATLLGQRNERIAQSLDTRDLDRQLFDLGYRPKAVLTTELLENNARRITFPTYLAIAEDRKARIIDRLGPHYPYMSAMTIHTELQTVSFVVAAGTSDAEIDAILDHFGYLGHE